MMIQEIFSWVYRILYASRYKSISWLYYYVTYLVLYCNKVEFASFSSRGIPKIYILPGGKCVIGKGFKINNNAYFNPIGRVDPCSIKVDRNGVLIIGDNVGMSSTAIVCTKKIEIGNHVLIGGNTVIYDTDFHSISYKYRVNRDLDRNNVKSASVRIGNNVFIGAHSTILKGVKIGDNSVVGACSVVTKDIPNNEIWAGNPAKFIKVVNEV
jgi:acetyltransferase-like isoleucine patch superfamily enzyme